MVAPARRLINIVELQNVHLNEITQFDFAEVIREVCVQLFVSNRQQAIPATRQLLQDSVMQDLKGWLLAIREQTQGVGEMAFMQTEKSRATWRKIAENHRILSTASYNSPLQRVFDEQDACFSLNYFLLTAFSRSYRQRFFLR
jgi:Exocyst complex component EXOC6/Sec15, N-terminal